MESGRPKTSDSVTLDLCTAFILRHVDPRNASLGCNDVPELVCVRRGTGGYAACEIPGLECTEVGPSVHLTSGRYSLVRIAAGYAAVHPRTDGEAARHVALWTTVQETHSFYVDSLGNGGWKQRTEGWLTVRLGCGRVSTRSDPRRSHRTAATIRRST